MSLKRIVQVELANDRCDCSELAVRRNMPWLEDKASPVEDVLM